ncbi:MAG: hypothetical protein JWQ81_6052 [Amycolatopsis sp.]|uniref:hypothetical protein n=1 Tax=Amycolatopsis sp. TaxID=37632 RepID=UPI00260B6A70|nr:hypothetical protein [Amycolatopsis sp.]MCU1685313.1 hypothetical protein [Amycolatopsis sp.]
MTNSNEHPERRGHVQTVIVQAVDMLGRPVPVSVSVLNTDGGLQISLRVDDGDEVILPDYSAINLSVRLQEAFRAKLEGDR